MFKVSANLPASIESVCVTSAPFSPILASIGVSLSMPPAALFSACKNSYKAPFASTESFWVNASISSPAAFAIFAGSLNSAVNTFLCLIKRQTTISHNHDHTDSVFYPFRNIFLVVFLSNIYLCQESFYHNGLQ